MNQIWHSTHPDFRFNGVHYAFDELQEVGYSLIKEGDTYEKLIGEFLLDWATDKPTIEVHTSGSTGKPKKIKIKKLHAVNSAQATGEYFGLSSGDSALLCLSCSGIAGKMMLVRAMMLGLELKSVEPSSTPMLDENFHFDFVAMVPLQVENSLNKLSQIQTLIIGGAPISVSLKEHLKTAPNAIFETYGMTETITHIAAKKLNGANKNLAKNTFQALPNVTLTKDGRDCLVISAPKLSDDNVITNDIVNLTTETTFKWLGRFDTVINSGGVKLIPEQIEQKLSTTITTRFFVAGMPDESLGEKLVLLVESVDISSEELLAQIKNLKNLDKYEIPKEVFVLKQFADTKTGKTDRSQTIKLL